jgi:adenylyltransferase/sulfurtransferase
MFTSEEIVRYSKQLMLDDIGPQGQTKLKQAKVLVIGAGGLGCPVLQYLNAVGIGTIGIAEFDLVDASNLHRQILYGPPDIGRKKVAVAMERLVAQNPMTSIIPHDLRICELNAPAIIEAYDFVVDGCDNFATRYIVNDVCVALGKPLVYGSILGYQGQVAVFNNKGSKHLRHIFPEPPNTGDVPDCSENGVLGTVPGIIGIIMAQTLISVILQRPSFENQLMLLNTLSMERVLLNI